MQNSEGGPIVSTDARRLDHPLECMRGGHGGQLDDDKGGYHGVVRISSISGSSPEQMGHQKFRVSGF
jgi:hypothetical protein